ncbi:MAG: hypothetical protein H6738_23300 [Alphaproteobacteria bacterium]|nr:hypothetical protein [Alphaproteobacteria bacterium]MCB9699732.1 hypothetical protein [Alphaproteobacteria bacterium]
MGYPSLRLYGFDPASHVLSCDVEVYELEGARLREWLGPPQVDRDDLWAWVVGDGQVSVLFASSSHEGQLPPDGLRWSLAWRPGGR